MTQNISGLTRDEAQLLAALAGANLHVFRYEDAAALWPATTSLRKVLSKLEGGGWLKRVQRKLYMLIPLEAGLERTWAEDTLVVGTRMISPSAIAYWSAMRYWNFTEQIPRTIFVQSPRRKPYSAVVIEQIRYRFVYIDTKRFFGITKRSGARQLFPVTDREKTVIDALERPDLSGGIRHLADTLRAHWSEIDWDRLDRYMLQFATGAIYKRLGYMIEALDIPIPLRVERLKNWQEYLTTGVALLEPGELPSGRTNMRWRVRDNLELKSTTFDGTV